MLVIAQSVSLRILTPPSDDPAMQSSQRILKYLPLMIGYFSLSVPAGLGVYWVINNILSTVTTGGIKEYFKRNPVAAFKIDLDILANSQQSVYNNPVWGYTWVSHLRYFLYSISTLNIHTTPPLPLLYSFLYINRLYFLLHISYPRKLFAQLPLILFWLIHSNKEQMYEEARLHYKPSRSPKIPVDFV